MMVTRSAICGHDAHVVGHKQNSDTALVGEVAHELQDLRLDGHVERRGRLVGDNKLRIARKRGGDDDALALAAGELMRIGLEAALRLGNADRLQQIREPGCARPRSSDAQMVRAGSR